MSVWSYGKGVLLFPKKAIKGVKESLNESFGSTECSVSVEVDDRYETPNYRRFLVTFSICSDGIEAASITNNALQNLKKLGGMGLDFDVNVRFYL